MKMPATALASRRATGAARVVRIGGPALPYDRTLPLARAVRQDPCARARARRPDVLEAHSPYLATAAVLACGAGCAGSARHSGTRITWAHTSSPPSSKALGPALARRIAAPLWQGVRALLAPFDATFVAGRAQAERLRAAGVPGRCRCPFGVDGRHVPSAAPSETRRRA